MDLDEYELVLLVPKVSKTSSSNDFGERTRLYLGGSLYEDMQSLVIELVGGVPPSVYINPTFPFGARLAGSGPIVTGNKTTGGPGRAWSATQSM